MKLQGDQCGWKGVREWEKKIHREFLKGTAWNHSSGRDLMIKFKVFSFYFMHNAKTVHVFQSLF